MARRQNYLNNKDMLKQIHISKSNYSWFEDRDKHHQHDIILYSTEEIADAVEQARQNKAKRLQKLAWDANEDKKKKQVDFEVDPTSFTEDEIVFRIMGFDHIPDEPGRKANPKTVADHKVKLPFPAFKHYTFVDGKLNEVGISHYNKDKEFDLGAGKITAILAPVLLFLASHHVCLDFSFLC